jgi:hypothetical protein
MGDAVIVSSSIVNRMHPGRLTPTSQDQVDPGEPTLHIRGFYLNGVEATA